jgi:hypothetical protein
MKDSGARKAAQTAVSYVQLVFGRQLRQSARVRGNWELTVVSANLDATAQVQAYAQTKDYYWYSPPPGAQYSLVSVSATYVGGGSENFRPLTPALEGVHNAQYSVSEECPTPSPISSTKDTFSGQTIAGNLCYLIASNDANSAQLVVTEYTQSDTKKQTWFALR